MPVNSEIDQILKAEWPSIKRQLSPPSCKPFNPFSGPRAEFMSWDHRLTPGFPSAWPCPPNGELIYYAWASGLQPRALMDAVRTAVPWARFKVSLADGSVTYQRFEEEPQMGDTQGMWPLSADDSALFNQSAVLFDEFPEALAGQGSLPDQSWLEHVRLSYRFWMKCNGVTARQIRPMHLEFFAWLESKSN